VGCRARRTQDQLLRVIGRSDGTLEVGRTLPGRGAWVCPDIRCIDQAERRKAFPRALKQDLAAGAVPALRARMVTEFDMEGR